ncbi:hypothetical protein Taro_024465 [Colocasia esculenta]|uniref:Uncharacterized protein n=1 Tax=Colocasia esculenta TaxID=4460 RepID=A0A843VKF2_COLES|nr:hypothetical protein [Colocasia esculenta]
MDTSRVLSGASSSVSQTSAFTTPGALGTPSEMMGFILDTISGLESRLAKTMESRMAQTMQVQVSNAVQAQLSQSQSQAISEALSQVSIPPQVAPSTSARAPHHGQGDGCDLWKLTKFNSNSRFELDAQIHLKQVPSSGGVGGDEDEDT